MRLVNEVIHHETQHVQRKPSRLAARSCFSLWIAKISFSKQMSAFNKSMYKSFLNYQDKPSPIDRQLLEWVKCKMRSFCVHDGDEHASLFFLYIINKITVRVCYNVRVEMVTYRCVPFYTKAWGLFEVKLICRGQMDWAFVILKTKLSFAGHSLSLGSWPNVILREPVWVYATASFLVMFISFSPQSVMGPNGYGACRPYCADVCSKP